MANLSSKIGVGGGGGIMILRGQKGGYLEDIEGSGPKILRTWSFLMSLMRFFYPMEDTLKIPCEYLK